MKISVAMYQAVKAVKTEISFVKKFGIVTIQQNLILLPTYLLYEMPPLAGISNQANSTEKFGVSCSILRLPSVTVLLIQR
jgi:hypothetical protein